MGTRMAQFRLPDLGEGLTEGEILQWLVKPGDTVRLNQAIVEVETAKAAVEVPSPYAGVVHELHHAAGTVVDVGAVIITVDTDPAAGPPPEAGATGAAAAAAAGAAANPVESAAARHAQASGSRAEVLADTVPAAAATGLVSGTTGLIGETTGLIGEATGLIGETGANGRTATLVGYGPRAGAAKRRPRVDPGPAAAPVAATPAGPVAAATPAAAAASSAELAPPPPADTAARVSAAAVGHRAAAAGVAVLAKPPVRKLARDLGLDLATVRGTGPHGTVTRADVEAAAAPAVPAASPVRASPDAARERRIPVRGVRRLTAAAMVGSAFTAPHVTEFVTLDMTPTMELKDKVAALPEFAGVKVSPLLFVAKALLLAVKRHPEVNSTWDEAAQEIVVKDYVHLGIAAATPRGLLVPNVKDADALDLLALARALQELTQTAREGRTPPADMTGGTITITNVGSFGVDNGTPILNPGESAILCLGAVRPTPWVVDGEIRVRQVTQLALSFDHRNIDGQLGSQFLSDLARVLADPALAVAWS